MTEIIKIHSDKQIGSEVVNTVNIKELYLKLTEGGDQSNLNRWIERNLIKNEFLKENKDYIIFATVEKTPTEGNFVHRTKTSNSNKKPGKYDNLYITLDTAKHLCMLSNCKNGHLIREYFLECEKKAIEASKKTEFEIPKNYAEALMEAGRLAALNCQLQEELNALHHSGKLYTATEIAKELNFKTTKEFNQSLHDKGIQYKVNGTWVLYSKYSDKGYVEVKQEILENGVVIYHRKFTQAGREFILSLYGVIDKENALTNNTCYDGLAKARELLELN